MAVTRNLPLGTVGLTQAGIATLAVGSLLFAPPARGEIALYPLTDASREALPRMMTQEGRKIVSTARFGGGVVVYGERPDFANALLEHGILVLGVPDRGCIGTA